MKKAYIDIETNYTGQFSDSDDRFFRDYHNHEITVLGLRIVGAQADQLIQLVNEEASRERLLETLSGAECLVTYNGRSVPDANGRCGFDFPVIVAQLGVVLDKKFRHVDLVPLCWSAGLYGGQKKVEMALGLKRKLPGKDGRWAMSTWRKYRDTGDRELLEQLLAYNREDVVMLEKIERALSRS